jgi:hypothetical protein
MKNEKLLLVINVLFPRGHDYLKHYDSGSHFHTK